MSKNAVERKVEIKLGNVVYQVEREFIGTVSREKILVNRLLESKKDLSFKITRGHSLGGRSTMSEKFNGLPVTIVYFDVDGKVTGEENYNLDKVEPDPWALKGLAGALLPHIQEFYSHEENIRAFESWQREQSVEQKPSSKKRKRKAP